MDVVAALGACTDSGFAHQYGLLGTFAPTASWPLLKTAMACASALGVDMKAGNVLSSDNFYNDGSDGPDQWKKMGVLAVEMEAAGLYRPPRGTASARLRSARSPTTSTARRSSLPRSARPPFPQYY